MDRIAYFQFLAGAFALLILVACTPAKPVKPDTSGPQFSTDTVFGVPYMPQRLTQLAGRPVAELSPGWTAACLYSLDTMNDKEKALIAGLQPAGGEGEVGVGFTRDLDGDGKIESVGYGAYLKAAEAGNFLLVTRETDGVPEVLLLKEYVQQPRITVFTLKADKTLYFGGGIDAGEVAFSLTWPATGPVAQPLAME